MQLIDSVCEANKLSNWAKKMQVYAMHFKWDFSFMYRVFSGCDF